MAGGAKQFTIGDAVKFNHRKGTITGHILEKPTRRGYAKVIDGEDRTWRVHETLLTASGAQRRKTILTPQDEARAKFRVNDTVHFSGPDGPVRGVITKLNPKRAQVRVDGQIWAVPYAALESDQKPGTRDGMGRLNDISKLARELMDSNGLSEWAFTLVESQRRLGDCNYRDRVIRISRTHALDGSEAEIRDTLLHEIAHALAGREAGHGPRWKEMAIRLGAKPSARAYESEMG